MNAAKLQAPAEHGMVLIVPPPCEWPALVEANGRLWNHVNILISGASLSEWRNAMRAIIRQLAQVQLTRWLRGVNLPQSGLLVTGHQPELFHPGVWAKHFATAEAAKRLSLAPLNLIADHDQPKNLALRVPVRSQTGLSAVWIPFCEANPVFPWEEYTVNCRDMPASAASTTGLALNHPTHFDAGHGNSCCSRGTLSTLAQRVSDVAGDLLPEMILPVFWSSVLSLLDRMGPTCSLVELLAGARRLWEERWGYHNAEVRVSSLCQTEPFLAFVADILANLPAFAAIHNDELLSFRRRHNIRSRTHPVPPLSKDGDWHEAPFWVWRAGQVRQRLWIQLRSGTWILRLGEHGPSLNVPAVQRREDLVEFGHCLKAAGWKIRPRALTLTLFARLFMAEMFVHGIGGGVYDRFTDRLIWRWWRLTPPHYAVVSATLRLPLAEPLPPPLSREVILRRLRDCQFNPERVLPHEKLSLPQVQQLVEHKRVLLRQWTEADLRQRRFLHHQLTEIRDALRPLAQSVEASLRTALQKVLAYQRQLALVRNREWSFVLHSNNALTQLVEGVRQEFARLC